MFKKILLVLLLLTGRLNAATYYVSATGSASNPGTHSAPWSLRYAISGNNRKVVAGSTIYLLAGTYYGHFIFNTPGTSSKPIKFLPYPGNRAILDAKFSTTTRTVIPAGTAYDRVDVYFDDPSDFNQGDTIVIADDTWVNDGVTDTYETVTVEYPITDPHIVHLRRDGCGLVCTGHSSGKTAWNFRVGLTINGSYTWLQNLEITDTSSGSKTIPGYGPGYTQGSSTGFVKNPRRGSIFVYGPGTKLIDNVIHDLLIGGINAWTQATNSEYYGNVLWANGWYAPDFPGRNGHGHGFYTEGTDPARKLMSQNIIAPEFGYNIQNAGSSASHTDNFTWQRNIGWVKNPVTDTAGTLFGGNGTGKNLLIDSNYFYGMAPNVGYGATLDGVTLSNNIIGRSRLSLKYSINFIATGNTVVNDGISDNRYLVALTFISPGATVPTNYAFSSNHYYQIGTDPDNFAYGMFSAAPVIAPLLDGCYIWWDITSYGYGYCSAPPTHAWHQTLGYDTNSTLAFTTPSDQTIILSDQYNKSRYTVVIYNWSLASTVSVTASRLGLKSGNTYTVRTAQNYLNDITTSTYSGGGSITLPMTGHTVATPSGFATPLASTTFPEFGVFVIEKQ